MRVTRGNPSPLPLHVSYALQLRQAVLYLWTNVCAQPDVEGFRIKESNAVEPLGECDPVFR